MKYKFYVKELYTGYILVEADSEEEARKELNFCDVDTEFESVIDVVLVDKQTGLTR